jgi:hypothetical protein
MSEARMKNSKSGKHKENKKINWKNCRVSNFPYYNNF